MSRPSFSIPRFRKIYNTVSIALQQFSQQELSPLNRAEVSDTVEKSLIPRDREISDKRLWFINSVLSKFDDCVLDSDTVKKIATVIAGCEREMENGITYQMWDVEDKPVWASLYIYSVNPVKHKGRMYRVILDSYGGLSSSRRFTVILPGPLLQIIIRTCGGKKTGEYKDVDAGGLWFTSVIGKVKARLKFEDIHASNSQAKHNKKILQDREKKCVKGKFTIPCFNCYVGRDECYLARHALSYQKGICRNDNELIGQHKGYIVEDGYCLHCLSKHLVT